MTQPVEPVGANENEQPASSVAQSRSKIRLRVVKACLLFSLGFSAVFVAMGAAAGEVGTWLRDNRQVLIPVSGVLIILFGLFVLGLVKLQPLLAERRFHLRRVGVFTAPLAGAAFAFGWTPCVGPFLGSLLLIAGSTGTAAKGAFYLAVYSAGLALPFLVTALLFTSLLGAFAWLKKRLAVINYIAGCFLIVTGLLLLLDRFGVVSSVIASLTDSLHVSDPSATAFSGARIGIVTSFVAGLLSFLSPCVLPLVPGYLCLVSGLSLEEITR